MKLSYDSIVQKLDEFFGAEEYEDSYANKIDPFDNEEYDELELGLGSIEEVDSHGGSDAGSDYWKVYHFIDHDVYLKIHGWYSSYDSTQWDGDGSFASGAIQVYPQTKTIVVYEKA